MARSAKFWILYKRGGHRVLINRRGDLVVRPNPMEASVSLVTCFDSVQHHLLTTYLQSLLAVLLSQFSTKQMKGGMQGVLRLAKLSLPLRVSLLLLSLKYLSNKATLSGEAEVMCLLLIAGLQTAEYGQQIKHRGRSG